VGPATFAEATGTFPSCVLYTQVTNTLALAFMKPAFAGPFRAAVLSLILTTSLWATPAAAPELPNPGSVSGISKEDQKKLGLQAAAEVYQQMPVLPDSSPETQYIQHLGRRLVAVIPEQYTWPYQFHVVQQKEINAFALPGGPMFVNVGTITAADNESELVGVMAHEMSHVYMQHSAKQASKASRAQGILGLIGGILGDSAIASLARAGIQFGAGTVFLKYSRDDEAQADAVGAIIMYKAGYNPQFLAQFFEKLTKQSGANGPQFLSDHPNPGNRTAAITKEIRDWPPKPYVSASSAFLAAKKAAEGETVYTAQQIAEGAKQGLWARQNEKSGATVRDLGIAAGTATVTSTPAGSDRLKDVKFEEIRPAADFTSLQKHVFSISYPANWQTTTNQDSLTIAPAGGVGGGAVAYGVIISGIENNTGSLDNATQTLAQNLAQSNPGMRVSGEPERIAVNGLQGRSVYLLSNSPVEQEGRALPERDWLVTVPRSGGLLYLIFVAPERDFPQLRPAYQRMLESLQVN
jgi:beta-barrel assembly-enhancing protease